MWQSQGLGYGQTWQDVSASRLNGVTYTNNYGRPIAVTATVYCDWSGPSGCSFLINGTIVQWAATPAVNPGEFPFFSIVPNGATYRIIATHGVYNWNELR